MLRGVQVRRGPDQFGLDLNRSYSDLNGSIAVVIEASSIVASNVDVQVGWLPLLPVRSTGSGLAPAPLRSSSPD